MTQNEYPRFCPVAMAADLLEPRWTLLVLCELWAGSTRFNEIQRGVPGMSPGLLSKRLRDMTTKGLVEHRLHPSGSHAEYVPTPLAETLEPIVRQLGEWAHRNVDSEVSLQSLDARTLMWNIRRKINRSALPIHKCVIQFTLKSPPEAAAQYWLVIKPGLETDLCYADPGFNVDLFVISDLRALTSAWMGHSTFGSEMAAGRITLVGHASMARDLTKWLVTSSFSKRGQAADLCESEAG